MQPMVWPPHLVAGAGNFPDSCLGGADTEVACSAASASLPFSTHLLSCVYQKNTYTRQGNDFIGNNTGVVGRRQLSRDMALKTSASSGAWLPLS